MDYTGTPCPSWVTMWYANDAFGQHMAIGHWRIATSTPAERAAAQSFVAACGFPCSGCGRFSFPEPTLCFWCRR